MSAKATRFVWENAQASGIHGNRLLTLLLLADKSKNRCAPFMAELSIRELQEKLGIKYAENAARLLRGLKKTGHIDIVMKGHGGMPNLYKFGRKGLSLGIWRGLSSGTTLKAVSTEAA